MRAVELMVYARYAFVLLVTTPVGVHYARVAGEKVGLVAPAGALPVDAPVAAAGPSAELREVETKGLDAGPVASGLAGSNSVKEGGREGRARRTRERERWRKRDGDAGGV